MLTALLLARVVLASVFALAAGTKLADLDGSRAAVAGFGVPARLARVIGTALPVAEVAVAVALLTAAGARLGAIGAGVLLALFAIAIARSMARGEAPDCHCFGRLHSEPAGASALARDLLLGAVAAFVAVAGWDDAGASAIAWIGRLAGSGLVAFVAGAALMALAVATAVGWSALLRQHGRLLLRIDELEARLDAAAAPPAPNPHLGLPIGTPAPPLALAGLDGDVVTLDALTAGEQPVLLFFTDPRCGPCKALMPQISAWQREHAAKLRIAVLTRGDAKDVRTAVREHGITRVALDDQLEAYNAYQARATPGAVLIDAQGRIASPSVVGAEAITGLVETALTQPPGAPRMPVVLMPGRRPPPAPRGRAIGTDAPPVELRGLDGGPLALVDGDRDTLVLFWNPGCGFCQRMLDDVRELERSADRPRLLLISAGTVEANRALRLEAPIVLDPDFTVASAFGSAGTPSAVLIDRDGKVASRLAVGSTAVLALAGEHATSATGRGRAAAEV